MSKREQILKTCIRKMHLTDFENIMDLNVDDTFEIERFVFSGKAAYIQVNLLDEILCAVIPEDELAYLLHSNEMIDDYDLSSFQVYFKEWDHTKELYTMNTASLEWYFNMLNTEIVKEILFDYADNYIEDAE